MPRGRHRHSPPLHRLLPPSAIAGVSLVCALGPWLFSEPAVLRVLAAAAAATAVGGAVVMRHWDIQAGKQVADLTRARASDEWQHEERVAELETDLEESRELRAKLEQRLRAKRTELAGLRNEHAALLRRYATAETERASALEGRRLLEIETTVPARALPPARAEQAAPEADAAPAVAAGSAAGTGTGAEGAKEAGAATGAAEEQQVTSAVFSPEGSRLFLRARAALGRLDGDGDGDGRDGGGRDAERGADGTADRKAGAPTGGKADTKTGGKADGGTDGKAGAKAEPKADAKTGDTAEGGSGRDRSAEPGGAGAEAAQEDEARGKPEAADGHERAAASTTGRTGTPAARRSSGHFVAPTAVAVVPQTPARRPSVEGGFDFFGTKQETSRATLEAVQNEDLADVVGQEALALHKAESEAEFKPAGEEARGVGQVIDLTVHDETEQIDIQGLRSAVS